MTLQTGVNLHIILTSSSQLQGCHTREMVGRGAGRLHCYDYRQISNICYTSVSKEIVDHSDAVGASPVGAAPTTSSFST